MSGTPMPFLGHIEELRSRIIKSVIAVVVGTIVSFVFYDQLIGLLARPYRLATGQEGLVYFRPTEAFSLAMRVSVFGGIVLASPVLLYQIWRFVAPALTPREKRWAVPLTVVFVVLFVSGVAIGYWSLARGLAFLLTFEGSGLQPLIRAEFYLEFAMRFLLAFGISFEFPVFLFAAAAFGAVKSSQLGKARRWAVVIILVFAAFITPSGDPVTLMLLSVPMYPPHEAAILAIRVFLKR